MSYLENIKVFVRVFELGSLSAAGRDQRVSPAVASNRIRELEKYLGVRLFNRTTRKLTPTEHGRVFYDGTVKVLEAVREAEDAVADISGNPKGVIHVTAPLGIGKRLIAPLIPEFQNAYPEVQVRLRLSDRHVDITTEAMDVAFRLGTIEDSNLRMRGLMQCKRAICAAPDYIDKRGAPAQADDLLGSDHNCLLLRFPGSKEFYWTLQMPTGPARFEVKGQFDSDDGDVLIEWALQGHGIINRPEFEIADHLHAGRLVPLLQDTPPVDAQLACLYPHKRFQDPKVRFFIEFAAQRCQDQIRKLLGSGFNDPATG
ncbi:MAG: LysR family transcriptional regulator [Anderseniella sp.]|nr:LysR family transcriptional regulator [Anderseniella sp.]